MASVSICAIAPCAELEGHICLEGKFHGVPFEKMEATLPELGFSILVVSARESLTAKRGRTLLIVSRNGEFSLSRTPTRSYAEDMLQEIAAKCG